MRSIRLAVPAAVLAVAACSAGSSSRPPGGGSGGSAPTAAAPTNILPSATLRGAAGHPAATWPTYHGDGRRTGVSSAAPLRPPLRRAWRVRLDGAVYAQPLVLGRLVVVATEHDTVYGLAARSGHVVWSRSLGTPVPQRDLPCGNIDPSGITGTPAYDARTGSVFVVTETTGARHILHALDARSGRERWRRGLDVVPGRDRSAEQQRGALLVAGGRVYVPFGGLFGDCGNYVGYVTAAATTGRGRIVHYAVPTAREAGMWAPPGPVQAASGGDVLVATGNGAETGGHYDDSDSVIRLSPRLVERSLFAPSTWREDNAQDLDLGSSSPVVLQDGRVIVAGKRGTVYLLDRLGGVGSQRATLNGCAAYGGAAFTGHVVVMPCRDGIRRLDVGPSSLGWQWRVTGVAGSPVIAGDVVYALDQDSGELVELSLRTGAVRARFGVGTVTRFATPVPVGARVYVGTTTGVVAVGGGA